MSVADKFFNNLESWYKYPVFIWLTQCRAVVSIIINTNCEEFSIYRGDELAGFGSFISKELNQTLIQVTH